MYMCVYKRTGTYLLLNVTADNQMSEHDVMLEQNY